jgi:hypothetical protein
MSLDVREIIFLLLIARRERLLEVETSNVVVTEVVTEAVNEVVREVVIDALREVSIAEVIEIPW